MSNQTKDLKDTIADALRGKKIVVFKTTINYKENKQYKAYSNEILSLQSVKAAGYQIESSTVDELEGIIEDFEVTQYEYEGETYTLVVRVNELKQTFTFYSMSEKLTFIE